MAQSLDYGMGDIYGQFFNDNDKKQVLLLKMKMSFLLRILPDQPF